MNRLQRFVTRLLGLPAPKPLAFDVESETRKMLNALAEQAMARTELEEIAPGMFARRISFPPVTISPHAKQPTLTVGVESERPGIKPPPDPQADGMEWSMWSKIMAEIALDGWSPCRFVNRLGDTEAAFVFGVTWQDFGIYDHPFAVCDYDDEVPEMKEDTILASLTYLPCGLGVAIFPDRETAARAAVLAAPIMHGALMSADQAGFADWQPRKERLHATWEFNGISPAGNRHAHSPHGQVLPIWSVVPAAEQPKPTVNS